jgi:hypothetical protein
MLPTLTQIKAKDHHEELLRNGQYRARTCRPRHPGSPPGFTRRPGARTLAVALGCILALSTVACSVVGPHGKLAGQSYGDWLRDSWQLALSKTPSASACQTMRIGGIKVAMLIGGYSGKPERHDCRIPGSTPLYVNGLSAECSTVEQPPFHATTPAGLHRCARRNFRGATNLAATVDNQPVRGYLALISASPVYTFHLPKHNLLGVAARSGRSAAYGEGLLLLGLAAGTHTIHITGDVPGAAFAYDVTYTLNVTP